MALPRLAPSTTTDLGEIRQDLFDTHVPWHRVRSVVDITTDSGSLLSSVLEDYAALDALVVDLTGDVRRTREELDAFGDRTEVHPGDVLDELRRGADYYLLPAGLEALDTGRLRRLMQSVSRACLPSGRAMACVPVDDAATIIAIAESAGLEVTRQGVESGLMLLEFGSGMLRALPSD